MEEPEAVSLLQARSTRNEVRAAVAGVAVYAVVILGLTPWATQSGPATPQVITVFMTVLIIAELTTAFLLGAEALAEPDVSALLVTGAYLMSALSAVAYVVTLPGAVVADQPVLGAGRITFYIFSVWRLGFAALVLAAVLAPRRGLGVGRRWRRIVWLTLGGIAAGTILLFVLGLSLERLLPPAMVDGRFSTSHVISSWAAVALGLTALFVLWTRRRGEDVLGLWLAVALAAFCGELAISTLGASRYSVGWYAGRTSGLISGSTLFVLFVLRYAAQQRISARTARRLQAEIARRSEAEARLLQAQKVEALGQLTGGIAHDFNNVLAAVVGNLDLLRRRPPTHERYGQFIENALSAAERGRKLTSQLLVFSRAQRLELKPLIVEDVVLDMREMLVRTLGPQVRVRMEVGGARLAVLSEATQLELAVLNLAINARDAMAEGGEVAISVTAVEVEDDPELESGSYVRLSVADTGAGMAPEVAARAFEPFFTTKGLGQGTGLGLSQVFGIARRASGTARIESREGEGATVHVFLRRTEAEPEAAAAPEPAAPAFELPAFRVLVVDDDPDVRGVMAETLVDQGFEVQQADNGADALKLLEGPAPDFLLLDFAMPGMDGAELGRRARRRHPDLPIVYMTGYADTRAIEAAVGLDAPILRKPFRIDELRSVIQTVMNPPLRAAE